MKKLITFAPAFQNNNTTFFDQTEKQGSQKKSEKRFGLKVRLTLLLPPLTKGRVN
jgi:hypothetical protein